MSKEKNYARKLAEYLASDEEYSVIENNQTNFGESKNLNPDELEKLIEGYFKGHSKRV